MKVMVSLAASPLHDHLRPQTTDEQHLDHYVRRIRAIRQGLISADIEYDVLNTGNEEESCKVVLTSDKGFGFIVLHKTDANMWKYEAQTEIDGEVTEYSGHGIHNSKQALVRKVAGLVRLLL